MNRTLSEPRQSFAGAADTIDHLKSVYRHREYFKTLAFKYDDMRAWLLSDARETMTRLGLSDELIEGILAGFGGRLEACRSEEDNSKFDFYKLFFANRQHSNVLEWIYGLDWLSAIPLKWLKRNWFHTELYWKEDINCSGFYVDDNPACDLRPKELELLSYTPQQCLNQELTGYIPGCDRLVSYVRLSTKSITEGLAFLQFMTTIFTCIILGAGAIMFGNDTQALVIIPITKMVGIIKTLADDPLQKPEPPQFDEDEDLQKG